MAELTAADLSTFTGGRLPNNSATTDLLNAALAAARRWCGWSVSPVQTDIVDVDGPGGRVLSLPTLNLIEVTAVSDNDIDIEASDLRWSRRKGTVTKRSGCYWSCLDGSISVTMTHGLTEDEAADWRRAVLELADLMSKESASQRDTADMIMKQIDDVQYQWAAGIISTDQRLAGMFSQFRILPSP